MSEGGVWDEYEKKYLVHEETKKEHEVFVSEGWKPFHALSLREVKIQLGVMNRVPPGAIPFNGLIHEKIIPAEHHPEGVPVSIYKPADLPTSPLVIIYFHGGGLVCQDRLGYDPAIKQLSMFMPAIVAVVGYRLLPCPEDPLAPFKDSVAATAWLLKNKETVGGQQSSKVAIIGDSAGGQLVSSVSYSIKEGIDFQIMIYPVADVKCDTESCKEFYETPVFSTKSMEKIIKIAGIGTEEMATNPLVNPSAREDLQTCPPSLILLAVLDPLRDWGVNFAQKLKEAGVDTELVSVEGVPHGFITFVGYYPTKSVEGLNYIKKFIQSRV